MEELQENMLEKLSTGAGQRLVRESIGRNAEFKRTIQGYYDQYQKDKCEAGHDKKLNSRKQGETRQRGSGNVGMTKRRRPQSSKVPHCNENVVHNCARADSRGDHRSLLMQMKAVSWHYDLENEKKSSLVAQ